MNSEIKTKGTVERIIQYDDGRVETSVIENTVLTTGQMALAASLAGAYGDFYDYFISKMQFGSGGTDGGVPLFVPTTAQGLFNPIGTKQVSAIIDPTVQTKVVFSTILSSSDFAGLILNEMALVMDNGTTYSMTTFPDLNKTSSMQITWNWRISFI